MMKNKIIKPLTALFLAVSLAFPSCKGHTQAIKQEEARAFMPMRAGEEIGLLYCEEEGPFATALEAVAARKAFDESFDPAADVKTYLPHYETSYIFVGKEKTPMFTNDPAGWYFSHDVRIYYHWESSKSPESAKIYVDLLNTYLASVPNVKKGIKVSKPVSYMEYQSDIKKEVPIQVVFVRAPFSMAKNYINDDSYESIFASFGLKAAVVQEMMESGTGRQEAIDLLVEEMLPYDAELVHLEENN